MKSSVISHGIHTEPRARSNSSWAFQGPRVGRGHGAPSITGHCGGAACWGATDLARMHPSHSHGMLLRGAAPSPIAYAYDMALGTGRQDSAAVRIEAWQPPPGCILTLPTAHLQRYTPAQGTQHGRGQQLGAGVFRCGKGSPGMLPALPSICLKTHATPWPTGRTDPVWCRQLLSCGLQSRLTLVLGGPWAVAVLCSH